MSDQCGPGQAWLCRDDFLDARPLEHLIWLSRNRPVSDKEDNELSWVVSEVNEIDTATALHIFGAIPAKNEARLVSTKELDMWCPGCRDWYPGEDKYINHEIGMFHRTVGYFCRKCGSPCFKSRARVLEKFNLEETK